MKKINYLLLVPLLLSLVVCCEQETNLHPETSVTTSTNEVSLKTTGSGWETVTSSCTQPSNSVEFLVPTNNNVNRTNLDNADNGMVGWGLVSSLSDEFNYSDGKSAPDFLSRWNLGYISAWTGPTPSRWSDGQVSFEDIGTDNRALVLKTARSGDDLLCGIITSKATSTYPLYQEVKIKISKSQVTNCVWMLSNDSSLEEIDLVETYGPDTRADGSSCLYPWYANKLHLSHHTFKINADGERIDYQPQESTWMQRKTGDCSSSLVNWSEKYHIIGVKWESATKLVYYVDGLKVKTVDGLECIDPEGYTECSGLKKEMHVLINQEAQAWRYGSTADFWASGDDLTGDNTKMYVDWIKVYTPNGQENRTTCN